jgi:hypothetical protein
VSAIPIPSHPLRVSPLPTPVPKGGDRVLRGISRALIVAIPAIWLLAFVLPYNTVLWILTGIGLLLTIAGFRRGPLGLLGVAILSCLDASTRVYLFTGGLFRWNTVSYLLVLAALLSLREFRRLGKGQLGLLIALTLLLGVELLVSPDKSSGIEHLVGLSAIYGMLGFCLRGGNQSQHWLWIARVCGVLGAAGGPFYFWLRDDLPYINPNAWAYLPVTAVLLSAVATTVIPPQDRRGILLPLCLALNLTWIFLSGSRGSLLVGIVAGGLFVLNWKGGAAARFAIAGACAVALATAGTFAQFETGMNERIEKLFEQDRSLSNRTSGRSDIAIVGWQMFRDAPLGVGTGGFMVTAPRYGRLARLDIFKGHAELQAHSAWIKTLGENGFPGVILLTAFICSFAEVGWRRRASGVLGLGVTVSLVLAIAFLSTEFQAKGLWLFAAAGMMILSRFSRRTSGAARASLPIRTPRAVA